MTRAYQRAAVVLVALAWAGLAVAAFTCGGCYAAPVAPPPPWPSPPPVTPVEPPPVFPPPEPPPVAGDLPALGTTKAAVVALWGAGTDLPENAGEDDAVSYVRTVDGREAEVHVIYRAGVVFRVVVSRLVTPGGG